MTRLADVTRPVGPAFFTPIIRPRVLQRIEAAAAARIVLIVAPAGYGKSLALTQWLVNRSDVALRFNAQPEHDTLIGFARGMAQACAPASPSLVKTVATAAKSSASAEAPGLEMARWMTANLEGFTGIIAIDDFQRSADDPEISRFLSEVIARTKTHVQWAIATRSTLDLPVASWLGYGDVHFIVGERELVFSEDETRELSDGTGEPLSAGMLREVMDVTAGWPVALGLALRSPAVLGGGAALANATREVVFEYLAEQVYREFRGDECELLHFASYLPAIQTEVLEVAGYPDCARVLESIRRRATFLTLEAPGIYKCHDLFHEFLRREIETKNPAAARKLQGAAAAALERIGNAGAALRLYTRLREEEQILRLLREHGFNLMDHSQGDIVEAAISVLPQSVRASDAAILGLRAQREADLGHFARAENLFETALRLSDSEPLTFRLALMLAVLLRNEDRRVSELLARVRHAAADKEGQLEVMALMAVDHALSHESKDAMHWTSLTEASYGDAGAVEVRTRVLLRLGIARLALGSPYDGVYNVLAQSAALAEEAGMLGMAARAYNVLGMAQLFYLADYATSLATLAKAIVAAQKGGDRFALQSIIVYTLLVQSSLGDEEAVERLLHALMAAVTSDAQRHRFVVSYASATLAGWRGEFAVAESLMCDVAARQYGYYDFDQAFNMGRHLLYMTSAGAPVDEKIRTRLKELLTKETLGYQYAREKRAMAVLFLALAECCAGAERSGRQTLERFRRLFSGRMSEVFSIVKAFIGGEAAIGYSDDGVFGSIFDLGFGGFARTIAPCIRLITASRADTHGNNIRLTNAERELLTLLDQGYKPREIAEMSDRSLHTVRTLIQRALRKLRCHSRAAAIAIAKKRQILTSVEKEPIR